MNILHDRLASSMVLFALLAAAWGLVAFARRRGMDGNLWGILAVGEVLFLAQGLLGFFLYLGGARPERGIHILYGVVALLTLPAYYAISKGRDDRTATLIYSLLYIFLAGIILRSTVTGG